MFFYIREPLNQGIYENHSQGYASKCEFMSEIFDGMVSCDGLTDMPLKFGDTLVCEVNSNT
jgi:hypothetical protein